MALNLQKTDEKLGLEVNEHLKKCGVQTPSIPNGLNSSEKIEKLETLFTLALQTMGLDLSDDSLVETPKRIAKMYVNEIFWGLRYDAFPKCTAVDNKMRYDEMIVERNINVQSNCEHHFVVIDGTATVAYIPREKVLGLSKINRVVEYFSKRPQIQERLTEQIYFALQYILKTDDIAVAVSAQHFCVKSRGVEDVGSSTTTSKLGGVFKEESTTRAEFLNLFNG